MNTVIVCITQSLCVQISMVDIVILYLLELKKIKSIENQADFRHSTLKTLENLHTIGGSAIFSLSQITNPGILQNIGGWGIFGKSSSHRSVRT